MKISRRQTIAGFGAMLSSLVTPLAKSFQTTNEVELEWNNAVQQDLKKYLQPPRGWHWADLGPGRAIGIAPDGLDPKFVRAEVKSELGIDDPNSRLEQVWDVPVFKAVVGPGTVQKKVVKWDADYSYLNVHATEGERKKWIVLLDSGSGIDLFVFTAGSHDLYARYLQEANSFFTAWNEVRRKSLNQQRQYAFLLQASRNSVGPSQNSVDPLNSLLANMRAEDKAVHGIIQGDLKDKKAKDEILNRQLYGHP